MAVFAALIGLAAASHPVVRSAPVVVSSTAARVELGPSTVHVFTTNARVSADIRGGLSAVSVRVVEPRRAAGAAATYPGPEVASARYPAEALRLGPAGTLLSCNRQFPGGNGDPIRVRLQVTAHYKDGSRLGSGWVEPTPVP